MKKLLNTLYVTSENSYLALDGENIVIYDDKKELGRVPLHNLEGIVSFGYRGTSPALMGACAERNISLCYMTPQGKFLARVTEPKSGETTTYSSLSLPIRPHRKDARVGAPTRWSTGILKNPWI